jgi:hypothetical protein
VTTCPPLSLVRSLLARAYEIPELRPTLEGLDLKGMVITLHAQQDAARLITQDHGGHYIMFVKANQPTLLSQVTAALSGTDAEFAGASWSEEGKGHGRRERRSIRTAPATGIDWPGSAQVMRIRRDTGPTSGHWATKEIAYAITSLPEDLAGPATSPPTPATTGASRIAGTTLGSRLSSLVQGAADARPPRCCAAICDHREQEAGVAGKLRRELLPPVAGWADSGGCAAQYCWS